jgi:hypothetical protein
MLAQSAGGRSPAQTPLQSLELSSVLRSAPSQRAEQSLQIGRDRPIQGLPIRADQFCGRRWRRGPAIGDKIGNGEVDLMADRADDGGLCGADAARKRFIVERSEILDRAATAGQQQDVAIGTLQRNRQGLAEFRRRFGALDLRRVDGHREVWGAPAQHLQHVAHGCAGRRGDDTQATRERGQWAFACGIEQTFRL